MNQSIKFGGWLLAIGCLCLLFKYRVRLSRVEAAGKIRMDHPSATLRVTRTQILPRKAD